MPHQDEVYLEELGHVLAKGVFKPDRTGVGSFSTFGRLARYNLWQNRLPILTTKKIICDAFIHEMLWFISGDTNIRYLLANNVSIWNSWLIDGTAEYGQATAEDYHKALRKHFKVKKLDFTFEGSIELDARYSFTNDPNPEHGLVVLNPLHFPRGSTHFVKTLAYFKQAYLEIMGEDLKVLVAGDIGEGGYGSQWRKWEDTRLVEGNDYQLYVDRGYEVVAEVMPPHKGEHLGKAVVTRKIDQLGNAIHLLTTNPDSRRIIVSAWNPGKIEDAALPPCHMSFQFSSTELTLKEMMELGTPAKMSGYTELLREYMFIKTPEVELDFEPERANENDEDYTCFKPGFTRKLRAMRQAHGFPVRGLTTLLLMRSNDLPIGHPFNIAQYGLLTHMVAQCTNHVARELVWVGADAHIYADQVDLAEDQMYRLPYTNVQPTVELNPDVMTIDGFKFSDITIKGYDAHHAFIPYPVAV